MPGVMRPINANFYQHIHCKTPPADNTHHEEDKVETLLHHCHTMLTPLLHHCYTTATPLQAGKQGRAKRKCMFGGVKVPDTIIFMQGKPFSW
jgi:hypothetical protein